MVNHIKIVIPGNPISKARPRFVKRGKFVGTYNAQETEEGRAMVHAIEAMKGREKITGPCSACIMFYFERPKSHLGTGKNSGLVKKSAPPFPAQKKRNDIDNLEKFALDICNGIAFEDDGLVVDMRSSKRYCAPGASGATVIRLEELLV